MKSSEYTLLGTLILPDRVVENGAVCVRDGVIVYSGSASSAPECGEVRRHAGLIAPGFVDIHCHAGGTVWSHDDPGEVADYHLAHGTTTMLETFYRDLGQAGMLDGVAKVKSAMETHKNIYGVHLEGPYLNPAYGAETGIAAVVRREDYMALADSGIIRQWTYAPEEAGTDEFLADIVKCGIVPAIGHSAASPEDVARAEMGGARIVTHLFDATGCYREAPEYTGTKDVTFDDAVLLADNFYYEIICDKAGIHVRPEKLHLACKTVGCERIVAITDSCADGSIKGDVNVNAEGELMGSYLTMEAAAKNFRALGFTLPEVFGFTSNNGAAALGIADRVGSLTIGHAADILLLTDKLDVVEVIKS